MKLICFLLGLMIAGSSARAEDITAMISQYRREHGLPAVKTDARLTAVAVRQAQAMASSGIMDHDVAGAVSNPGTGAQQASAGRNNTDADPNPARQPRPLYEPPRRHNQPALTPC